MASQFEYVKERGAGFRHSSRHTKPRGMRDAALCEWGIASQELNDDLEGWYERTHKADASTAMIPNEAVQRRFHELRKEWIRETSKFSFLPQIVMNDAYQNIIAMGPAVIPLILRSLRKACHHWFWALKALTQGVDPADGAVDLETARLAWLRWGEDQGYLDRR